MKKGAKNKRLTLVLVVSIILFVILAFSIIGAVIVFFLPSFSSSMFSLPLWYPFYGLASTIIEIILVVFILNMKKLALILFTVLFIIETILDFIIVGFSWSALAIVILELVLIGLLYTKYSLMK